MSTVFAELGHGSAASTVRVRAEADGAMASAMAAAIPSLGVSGGKVYSTVDGRFTFVVVLFDLDGHVLCTLDGSALTEARTAALTGVVVDRLAPEKSAVAAVLGTGREAIPHIDMLSRRSTFESIRLWGRNPANAVDLANQCVERGIDVTAAQTSSDAVHDADVVITVTSADQPIVDDAAIASNALVCGIGATKARRCELPPDLFGRAAAVLTDSPDGARSECGDLIHAVAARTFSWDRLLGLADLLAGAAHVERARPGAPVVFESQGVAAQDIAAAALAWHAFTESDGDPTSPNKPTH